MSALTHRYMYGRDVARLIPRHTCVVCQRAMPDTHDAAWCRECNREWVDAYPRRQYTRNPLKIANVVRKRHRLRPLSAVQVAMRMAEEDAKGSPYPATAFVRSWFRYLSRRAKRKTTRK